MATLIERLEFAFRGRITEWLNTKVEVALLERHEAGGCKETFSLFAVIHKFNMKEKLIVGKKRGGFKSCLERTHWPS